MVRSYHRRLERVAQQLEEMQASVIPSEPQAFESEDEVLDFLAEYLPDWLEEQITGDTEGFARRLDAYSGRLSKAPGFMAAFKIYSYQQYEAHAVNGGNLWLFIPGDGATRYEQARRDVVRMLREQMLASGDELDALFAEALCDETLADLGRRWGRVRMETINKMNAL
jgi:hypothetical protein